MERDQYVTRAAFVVLALLALAALLWLLSTEMTVGDGDDAGDDQEGGES